MSISVFKKITLAAFMTVSASVMAGPLSDYNVIITGDLNPANDVHLHGKTFVGGNLRKVSISGSDLTSATDSTDTLEVVGNVDATSTDLHLKHGSLAYGGTLSGNVDCQSVPSCTHQVSGLSDKRDSLIAELQSESDYYKNLAPTGSVVGQSFVYSGAATELAVFNISGADLFGHDWNSLVFGNSQRFVFNISGVNLGADAWGNGLNTHLNGNFSDNLENILWNFYEAETIKFSDGWKGSAIALKAAVDINNEFKGSLAAKSYIGNGQIHNHTWDYNPPKTEVPEPSSLLLSLFGLGLVLLGRARRQK